MAPLAIWKDLCIDVVDVDVAGPFWAAALGLTLRRLGDGDVRLDGPTAEHTVWLNTVPEPVTVKQRVHVDVVAPSVAAVEGLGATRVGEDGAFPWTTLTDPEGGELCVFERADAAAPRLKDVVVDAIDHQAIATWWHQVLGGTLSTDEDGDYHWLDDIPGAPFESMDFVPVPEPKAVKNRIHWDVSVTDQAALAALVAAGATVVRARDDAIRWHVLADPEGNEFCAFVDDEG